MKVAPARVASLYSGLIVALALLHIVGLYVPNTAEEGEFYFPYLFVSGPLVWLASLKLTLYTKFTISLHLESPWGPLIWVVIVPGVYNIILGSVQWYLFTALILKCRRWVGR